MVRLLIFIVYFSFISLGLPDSLLGSAWPLMHVKLGANNEFAGIVAFTVSVCTVIASLFSSQLIQRLGTGKVTLLSVLSTVIGVTGYSLAGKVCFLIPSAMFLGMGAGAVDTALSNYVALHFAAKHMSWLHCFWGIGAMSGTYIMAGFLGMGEWRWGFRAVGAVLAIIVVTLIFSQKLWYIYEKEPAKAEEEEKIVTNSDAIKLKDVTKYMMAMFCNNGYETTIGVWMATYFISVKDMKIEVAAAYCSMLYLGITLGRVVSGALSEKVSDKQFIRFGTILAIGGVAVIILPLPQIFAAPGLFIVGFGAAPVFPSILHLTPEKYGERNSATVIGLEMSAAYVGAACMPGITGFIFGKLGMSFIPVVVLVLFLIMLVATESASKNSGMAM